MPVKLNEREYRSCTEFRAADDDSYIVEGYACTFNQPYTLYEDDEMVLREQIDPHAFDDCDMSDVILLYNHEGRVHARTRNKTLQLTVDTHGLATRADLSGTEGGRQMRNDIKGGYIDRMSFAFVVAEDKRTEETVNGKRIFTRTITKIRKVYDVSAVSQPANDNTVISARSYCDGWITELAAERQSALDKQKLILKLRLEEIT